MEKDAAAIDTVEFTDNFICRSSITRSDMLFITLGSSIFAKELPNCVSTGDQALITQRGSSIIIPFLPYGFWWSLSRISVTRLKYEMEACPIRLFLRDGYLSTKILIVGQNTHYLIRKHAFGIGAAGAAGAMRESGFGLRHWHSGCFCHWGK